ncbi:MAG TPA: class I SAM-dependent methyltransferase [Ruminiclostridium sp.]|nr:class I SAM-dependent methyltransferase [Ruminiclostridium sp.]
MNTEKFTGKARIYQKYRAHYPEQFIEYLFFTGELDKHSTIADIGSGTGILTRQLLEKGCRVLGVEPNDDMRTIAEMELASYKNFVSVNGTAENTTLQEKSADCLTAAQSFHWFDPESFKSECRRVLKPGCKVVLVWNSRIMESKVILENAEICSQLCPKFRGFSGGYDENPSSYLSFFRQGECELKTFENNIVYNREAFVGRNLSSSYAPKMGEDNYDRFIYELNNLFDKFSKEGRLILPNVTRSYSGRV